MESKVKYKTKKTQRNVEKQIEQNKTKKKNQGNLTKKGLKFSREIVEGIWKRCVRKKNRIMFVSTHE